MANRRHVLGMLSTFYDGELSTDDQRIVSAHLPACLGCRDSWGRLREVGGLLKLMRPAQPPGDLWNGICRRLGLH